MDNYIRIILLLLLSFRLFGQSTETTSAFDVNSAQPIDTRLRISALADTSTIDYLYAGLITYVSNVDAYYYYNGTNWVQMSLGTGGELPPTLDYLDFTNNIADQSYLEGRIYYDTTNHTLTFFDDEAESSLQIGQEQRVRVFNNNGSTITNGYAVSVTGLTADGILEVGLAIASDKESALNTIGIATHDIEVGTYGWATTHGIVRGVNTSSLTGGAAIYLSDSVAGWYTTERPLSPSYEVRMGRVVQQDTTEGQLYAELRIITNTHDNFNFFTGAILEYNSPTITASGGVVTSVLTNTEGGDSINLIFDDGYLRVESGISVNLTLGTDSAPVENFVYITDAGVMTTSTSSFPLSGDYVPVGRYVVGSAARAESYGVYKSHSYTDHLRGGSNGHLSHINEWIRSRPAEWQSGVVLTTSAAVGVATDTIDLSFTSGVVSQLHNQTFPAFDTETDASFVVNDFATPYEIIEGITPSIDTDSEGNAIGNNKYYNIVIWGVASQEAKDCKIFYNLPSGSYTGEADALNDIDDYTSFSIPTEYTGTGFLISKLTIQRTNTTVKIIDITDLRGSIPIAGGGATAGGQGITSFDELTDSPASKAGAAGYHVKVNGTENALEYVAPETNFYDDDDTLSDNRIVQINSYYLGFVGGNVGIGIATPNELLHIEGVDPEIMLSNLYQDVDDQDWSIGLHGDDFSIYNYNDINGWPVLGLNYLNIDQNGNLSTTANYTTQGSVGIGTTTPSYNLHVLGTSGSPQLQVGTATNGLQLNVFDSGNSYLTGTGAVQQALHFGTQNKGNLWFMTDNTDRMVLDTLGNVGIGTPTPSAKLHIPKDAAHPEELIIGDDLSFWSSGLNSRSSIQLGSDNSITQFGVGQSALNHASLSWIYNATPSNAYGDLSTAGGNNPLVLQSSGGNVGIGTTTPSAKLDVAVGASSYTNNIKFGDGNEGYLASGASGIFLSNNLGNPVLMATHGGNVGIGTTAPSVQLDIEGANPLIEFNNTTSSQRWQIGSSGSPSFFLYDATNGNIPFLIQSSAPANSFTINPLGNVGIGTTSPTNRLTINEDINEPATVGIFSTSGNVDIKLGQGASNNLTTRWVYSSTPANAYAWIVSDSYNNDIRIDAADLLLQTAQVGANVGIGTTSPSAKLHTLGTAYADMPISQATQTNSSAGYRLWNNNGSQKWGIITGNTTNTYSSDFAIYNETSDSRPFLIGTSGNVGIGTTAPTAKLDVRGTMFMENASIGAYITAHLPEGNSGTDWDALMLDAEDNTTNPTRIVFRWQSLVDGPAIASHYTSTTEGDLAFEVYDSDARYELMRLDGSSGNVGIGTTGPSEKLDVNGNARIQSIGSGTSSGALHYEADGTLTTNTSDRRLKKNIVEVNDSIALQKLLELKPSEFNWKQSKKVMRDSSFINERKQNIIELTMQIDSLQGANTGSGTSIPNQIKELTQQRETAKKELKQYRKINKKRKENTDRINIGFIAQDVAEVLPSAVGKNDDGYLFLRDEQIGAITVSAIKEQQRQIEEQKQLIQQLLQRIEALENE